MHSIYFLETMHKHNNKRPQHQLKCRPQRISETRIRQCLVDCNILY